MFSSHSVAGLLGEVAVLLPAFLLPADQVLFAVGGIVQTGQLQTLLVLVTVLSGNPTVRNGIFTLYGCSVSKCIFDCDVLVISEIDIISVSIKRSST
ncbi:MAG TPA: hypothetical protein DCR92_04575 [Faecalibacterium sp.]|nr:hypothetical protein [Faecalibacterium sp.]